MNRREESISEAQCRAFLARGCVYEAAWVQWMRENGLWAWPSLA